MRQKEVPGRYCRSNICRGFRHLQSYPCQGAPNCCGVSHKAFFNKNKPRFSRVDPVITCTSRQVGRLFCASLLPTSIAGQSRNGRPAIHTESFPASLGKNVGLKESITHQAGNMAVVIGARFPRRRKAGPSWRYRPPPTLFHPRWPGAFLRRPLRRISKC